MPTTEMTGPTAIATAPAPARPNDDEALPPRWRQRLASLRARMVLWHVVMLVLGVVLILATTHLSLLAHLDERIDRELRQEVAELRSLADGLDPATGEPFGGDIERLFEVFLGRNLPVRNELMLTFVDGQPFRSSASASTADFEPGPALASRWSGVDTAQRAHVQLPDVGRLEYLAVPVRVDGAPAGVFVVAHLRDLERRELDDVLRNASVIGLLVLGLAVAVAWNVAGRVLEPVRGLTATTRAITETDLSRRIPARGADEVSVLAETFNRMLDRLESAFASQREFIDDAGHELRTPITIIRGHLELLDHDDPYDRAATIALVVDELDRMHRMVEDLLLLAKSEQPDFLALETVDLDALTREVHAKASGLAARDWRIDRTGHAQVVADRQRLTQALVQLCQNAVQHTGEGASVALGSAVTGSEARLWVRDSGSGVPAGQQGRIFERFARGAPTRASGEGAGLGLAIVRAIAEAHRGRVELDSRPGDGATFTIVVPVEQAGEPP